MRRLVLTMMAALAFATGSAFAESNINPGHKFAWGENIGWTNWRDANGGADGVRILDTYLSGRIWCENVGWMSVGDGTPGGGSFYTNADGADFGVNIVDAVGHLEGFGWAENIGWVNFDTASIGAQRARYDRAAGRLRGFAWGENVGWINLDDDEHFVAVAVSAAGLDIKPGSCPNSYNRGSHGVLPVALLGAGEFDVTDVDISTLVISRADGIGGSVGPNEGPPGPHTVLEDVATPFVGETCDCHELDGDGIVDLSMKFRTDDVVEALQLNDFNPGALVELAVSGSMFDGTPFEARDCVRLVPPGTPPGMVAVQSSAPGVWVDVSPLDEQLDGGGFAHFQRTFPLSTVVTLTAANRHEGRAFKRWVVDGIPQPIGNPTIQRTVTGVNHSLVVEYRSSGLQSFPDAQGTQTLP